MTVPRVARLSVFACAGLLALAVFAPAASARRPPDRIVFERHGDLYTIRLGHRPVRLTSTAANEHQPVWAPDDRHVAFAVGKRAVGVMDVATGGRRVIAQLPYRFDEIGALAWSPAGSRIEIAAMNNFARDGKYRLNGTIWSVAANGRGLTQVLTGQGLITGLAFTPSGARVFASTEWPNGVVLWHRHAPLGVISFAPEGSALGVVKATLASDLDVSPDGRRVAYRGWSRTCHGCGEIWTMAPNGAGADVIKLPPKGYYGLYDPRFSPSGRRIALLAAKGRRASLWVMRSNGARLHRIVGRVSGLDW